MNNSQVSIQSKSKFFRDIFRPEKKQCIKVTSTCQDWNWHHRLGHCVRGGSLTHWPSSHPWSSPARHQTPCQSDLSLRAELLNLYYRTPMTSDVLQSLLIVVPAADLTLRSFFGVTLHTLTVESAKPPAIKLESSVTSTPVRPCRHRGVNFFQFWNAVSVCSAGVGTMQRCCTDSWTQTGGNTNRRSETAPNVCSFLYSLGWSKASKASFLAATLPLVAHLA